MSTILAAIDFSQVSRKVLSTACEVARAIGGRLVVLHVVKTPEIATELSPLVGAVVQFTNELERAARRRLQRIQKQLVNQGVAVQTLCLQGAPVRLILAQAKEVDARYIVLGFHGHAAFFNLLSENTASGVLKRSTCPVMIVPADRARAKRSPADKEGVRMR